MMKVNPPKDFGGCLSINGMALTISGQFECDDAVGKELIAHHGFTNAADAPSLAGVDNEVQERFAKYTEDVKEGLRREAEKLAEDREAFEKEKQAFLEAQTKPKDDTTA